MKMKYAVPVYVAMLALGPATAGVAADYGSPSDASTTKAQSPDSKAAVTGTVQKVDVSNSSVQIKDAGGNVQTVKVDVYTQIARQGDTIQLAELKKGDVVTIKNAGPTM